MKREEFFDLILSKCDMEDISNPQDSINFDDIDSLDVITILSLFKQNFDISVKVEQLQNCSSMDDILDLAGNKYEK